MSRASASVEEYKEVLNAEQWVDLEKLKDFTRNGIPDEIRGEVWLYLLDILSPDKSSDLSQARSLVSIYASLSTAPPIVKTEGLRENHDRFLHLIPPLAAAYHAKHFGSVSLERKVRYATGADVDISSSGDDGVHEDDDELMNENNWPPLDEGSIRSVNRQQTYGTGGSTGAEDSGESSRGGSRVVEGYHDGTSSHSRTTSISSGTGNSFVTTSDSLSSIPPPSLPPLPAPPTLQRSLSSQRQIQKGLASTGSLLLPPSSKLPPSLQTFVKVCSSVIGTYVNTKEETTIPGLLAEGGDRKVVEKWIETVAPFVYCVKLEAGVYWGWEKLMKVMETFFSANPLPLRLAHFMQLFRMHLPDLYNYFEDEEVPMVEVAAVWLSSLFAGQMQPADVLRLWDTYLSLSPASLFSLHPFVCLSVLTACNDVLEELDQSEARGMLLSLPSLDISRILHNATNLRVSHEAMLAKQ